MSLIDSQIQSCLKILNRGGTILYPTDTIWGIGCDATDPEAVARIYRLKQRVESKSMIILLDDAEKLGDYVTDIPAIAWDLIRNVDTPLTIIYQGAKNLAHNVIATDGSVAIRIVRHDFCRKLIHEFGKPIVSTSANISGAAAPLTFKNIIRDIADGVDYVVDESLGYLQDLKPSRIIQLFPNGEFRIIRK